MNKKGLEIRSMLPIVLAFVVIAIVASYGVVILADIDADTANVNASLALNDSINAVTTFPQKMPLLATVVIAVIILGTIIVYFGRGLGN